MLGPSPEAFAGKKKSSSESPEARGTIDPTTPEKARGLNEEIAALTRQKEAAGANLTELDAKMEEIKNGPQSADLRDINLKLLNQYQEERNKLKERYGSLARQIAEKKIALEDLSN